MSLTFFENPFRSSPLMGLPKRIVIDRGFSIETVGDKSFLVGIVFAQRFAVD